MVWEELIFINLHRAEIALELEVAHPCISKEAKQKSRPKALENKKKHDHLVSLVNEVTRFNEELQSLSPNTDTYDNFKKEAEMVDGMIDSEVYKLYGLTDEEIKTIENSISL